METNRRAIVARLEAEGWTFQRHGANHDVYRHPQRGQTHVPRHSTLTPGVVKSIARKAGWRSDAD